MAGGELGIDHQTPRLTGVSKQLENGCQQKDNSDYEFGGFWREAARIISESILVRVESWIAARIRIIQK